MKTNLTRGPAVAGQFYEADRAAVLEDIETCTGRYRLPADLKPLVGGIVPHAGWVFSGPTAGKVFRALAAGAPGTYVLFGAVHRAGIAKASVYPAGKWVTPLGECLVDESLASELLRTAPDLLTASPEAHRGEHSIEVQVPFIQALSPQARIVPVAVPMMGAATEVGRAVAAVIKAWKGPVTCVASTDLTHYGLDYGGASRGPLTTAMPWMRANDARIIRLAEELLAEEIVPEAEEHGNACGAGAMAAATAAASALGAARGRVLEYTTSADVTEDYRGSHAVGYVGIVFEKNGPKTPRTGGQS
jgi:AmmeMemoRadiSam system protein B